MGDSVSVYEVKKKSKLKGVNWVAVWKEHREGSSLRKLEKKYNLNRGLLWVGIQAVESVVHQLYEYQEAKEEAERKVQELKSRFKKLKQELKEMAEALQNKQNDFIYGLIYGALIGALIGVLVMGVLERWVF